MTHILTPGGEGEVLLEGLASTGAETFDVEEGPAGGTLIATASGFAGPDFLLTGVAAGDREVRVAGRNAAGLGPWSAPASVAVT